ncbi:MAG TPA: class I SAM-dependent methyltransferase, partial [Flavisolibacter sp.]|nr:class I SAM-dependent methyltransferase [Flavisolibacter sp.]
SSNAIIQYKRQRVREHVMDLLPTGASILELNCGTGEDALFFAQQGYRVHATDVADGMLQRLKEKAVQSAFAQNITAESCSFHQLEALANRGPFDAVFSNFGGLNCTGELEKVLRSLSPLVKPNGIVTLVVIPPFCLWETLLLFKGKWKTATRRFFSAKGRKANVEGVSFKCWYYHPSFVIRHLQPPFVMEKLEGLCTLVPPSYLEGFAEKHPELYRFLRKQEDRLKSAWPWRSMGDYFIISLRKKA